jgi:hypothetical protein
LKSPVLSSPKNQAAKKFLQNLQLTKLKSNQDLKPEMHKMPTARAGKEVSGLRKLEKAYSQTKLGNESTQSN